MDTETKTHKAELLTIREVSEKLGLSRSTLYRMDENGELLMVRLRPRCVRYLRTVVDGYISKLGSIKPIF